MNKKAISYIGIGIGIIAIGFVTNRIISRWNKEVISSWRGVILVSKADYSNAESIGWDDEIAVEEQGAEQEWTDISEVPDAEIEQYLAENDFDANV